MHRCHSIAFNFVHPYWTLTEVRQVLSSLHDLHCKILHNIEANRLLLIELVSINGRLRSKANVVESYIHLLLYLSLLSGLYFLLFSFIIILFLNFSQYYNLEGRCTHYLHNLIHFPL